MNVEIDGGFEVEINQKDKTAKLKKIPKEVDTLIIPRYAEYKNQKYKITSLLFYFNSYKIGFLTFPEDSEVEKFESNCFNGTHIKKLKIPPKLKYLENGWAANLEDLSEIEISPNKDSFIYYDNKFLLGKSENDSGEFDVLYFTRRDIEEVVIPDQVRIIKTNSLSCSYQMKSITFSPNSKLEFIENFAFCNSKFQKLMLPASIKVISHYFFAHVYDLVDLELQAKSVTLNSDCFSICQNLSTVTFSNTTKITVDKDAMNKVPESAKFFVRRDAQLTGDDVELFKSHISYIDSTKKVTKSDKETTKEKDTKLSNSTANKSSTSPDSNTSNLKNFIGYLTSRLSQYEDVVTFEEFVRNPTKYPPKSSDDKKDHKNGQNTNNRTPNNLDIFQCNEIDELHVVKTVGRGAQSEVYEVIRDQKLALKVLLVSGSKKDPEIFKNMKRLFQEYEILHLLNHRNIIRAYGFCFGDENHTPSILLEFCCKNLNDAVFEMTDIEKVCCIFEICLGMEAVHAANVIHRDLKPENILIDENGHVKLSDFGISCYVDVESQTQSKTAGIGTLKFMAPELLKESTHYDNKVDVYSFGVVVFFILSGKLPSINVVDQGNGKKAVIPKKINKVSRELINKCWTTDPIDRPSFTEIIEYIKSNKFKLIDGVENEINEIKSFLSL